tara:strand:- start:792 stop:1298 length:507 start_codon:yes stop_codon:yes gene_type:complete
MGTTVIILSKDIDSVKFVRETNGTWTQTTAMTGDHTSTFIEKSVSRNEIILHDEITKPIKLEIHGQSVRVFMEMDDETWIELYEGYTSQIITEEPKDDNAEIMDLLQKRLELGKYRYGHGVIVDDDTKQYGTGDNSWEEMMLEEALDGMVYAAACMIRVKRSKSKITP